MESVNRVFPIPQESCFIFGPRGTGKSTWVKAVYPQATILDLLEPDTYRQYKSFPERLREVVAGSNQPIL